MSMEPEDVLEELLSHIQKKDKLLHRQIVNTDDEERQDLAALFWHKNRQKIQNEFSPEATKEFDKFAEEILDVTYKAPPKAKRIKAKPGQSLMDQINKLKPDEKFLQAAQDLLDYNLPPTNDPNYREYRDQYRENLKDTLNEATRYEDLSAFSAQTGEANANTWRGMAESLKHKEAIGKLPLEPTESQRKNYEKVREQESKNLDAEAERLSSALKERKKKASKVIDIKEALQERQARSTKEDSIASQIQNYAADNAIDVFNAGNDATALIEDPELYKQYEAMVGKDNAIAKEDLYNNNEFAEQLAWISADLRGKIEQEAKRGWKIGLNLSLNKFPDNFADQLSQYDIVKETVDELEKEAKEIKKNISLGIVPDRERLETVGKKRAAAVSPLEPESQRRKTTPKMPKPPAEAPPERPRSQDVDEERNNNLTRKKSSSKAEEVPAGNTGQKSDVSNSTKTNDTNNMSQVQREEFESILNLFKEQEAQNQKIQNAMMLKRAEEGYNKTKQVVNANNTTKGKRRWGDRFGLKRNRNNNNPLLSR